MEQESGLVGEIREMERGRGGGLEREGERECERERERGGRMVK